MKRSAVWILAYLIVWSAALAALVVFEHFEWVEPLFLLGVMGGGFSLLAWLLTRKSAEMPVEVGPAAPVLAYLIVIAAFVTWGLGALPKTQPEHDMLAMVTKLVVFVIIPALLFRTKVTWRWGNTVAFVVLAIALAALQAVFGSGFKRIASAHLTPTQIALAAILGFVWLCIEAGLVEEYFFRAVLQTRLERLTQSKAGGVVLASVLFALIHAPGLYLRGDLTNEGLGHTSLLMAIGYVIVILSPAGLFFGLLWSRTRNLPLVIALHGFTDLIPGLVPFARNFHLA